MEHHIFIRQDPEETSKYKDKFKKKDYIHPWRDQLGTDLDKAKAVLADKSLSGTRLSEISKIAQQTISNYRNGRISIKSASWKNVSKLARVYEALAIQKDLEGRQASFNHFLQILNKALSKSADKLENSSYPELADTVDLLTYMVNSDIVTMVALYNDYVDNLEEKN